MSALALGPIEVYNVNSALLSFFAATLVHCAQLLVLLPLLVPCTFEIEELKVSNSISKPAETEGQKYLYIDFYQARIYKSDSHLVSRDSWLVARVYRT